MTSWTPFSCRELLELGSLYRCRVWHDNKGFGAAWHLDYIKVEEVRKRRTWLFPCKKWLSLSDDDKQIQRDLVCEAAAGEVQEDREALLHTSYLIEVLTADRENAGMHHNAWLQLASKRDISKVFYMKNSPTDKIKVLRRGDVDTFTFKTKNLGPLTKLVLGAVEREDRSLGDVKGRDGMWNCHQVNVTDNSTGTKYTFPVKKWISITPIATKTSGVEVDMDEILEDETKSRIKKIRGTIVYFIEYNVSCRLSVKTQTMR